jgi:hypothetical protein
MRKKLTPEDLQNESEFELLTEISHHELREFVISQIAREKFIIRIYSVYQVVMVMLFTFVFTRGIVMAIKGFPELIITVGIAIGCSLSALIIIHELLHALAYLLCGARRISFGSDLRKFIFYALADKQVIAPGAFRVVALMPFVVVKVFCLIAIIVFYGQSVVYFPIAVMCLHSLFCAGDIAMLAFYRLHRDKEIYNYDDKREGKTYFYTRKIRT